MGCGGLVVGGTGTYRSIKERTARKAAEQGSVMMASRPVDPIGTSGSVLKPAFGRAGRSLNSARALHIIFRQIPELRGGGEQWLLKVEP